ncbi:MAG: 16S rRNA (adenine(1518)-N(6)/adenine(1519)-N(6))-dimethyltransferase RsmA [Planctomycetota bacterium]|nr:16S rRNA (adenine(1518)-N(6)/adenine(1519)-N(6))-dimethyltransferase RsmA [Planctomycetota bacterium]
MGVYQKLRARLEQAGIRPSTRRGQNFLLDANLLDFIVRTADLSKDDLILEVGPGSGFLTRRLAASGCALLGVELDFGLLPIAMEETAAFPNVILIQGDILAGKSRLNPEAVAKLEGLLAAVKPGGALKCVSNLPYSAGTPFIMNLLSSPLPWRLGVFLLQRETAERLIARPGGGDYGALSIQAQLAATTSLEKTAAPGSFWPVPKVESALVRMELKPAGDRLALPWPALRALTGAVFGARRKILKNALRGLLEKGREAEILNEAGLDPGGRGECLRPEDFLALARRLEAGAAGSIC